MNMTDEQIKATVFELFNGECIAKTEDGSTIHIDPFVTCAFEWDSAEKLIGTWVFKGFWNEQRDCFLANEIYHPLNEKLQRQVEEMQKVLEELHAHYDFEEPVESGQPYRFDDGSGVSEAHAKAYTLIQSLKGDKP